jgi:hypothetical protein
MFVFPVASSHDQPIICPCYNVQGFMRKASPFNYEVVVSSGLEEASRKIIQLLYKIINLSMIMGASATK